jgi:hypothetical protein
MRRMEMMTAGGITLAGLGALVGLAIGSGGGGQKLPLPRAQPVEVRTETIRKTVNVYRREHPHHVAGAGPAGTSASRTHAPGATALASVATRTRSSGAGAVAPAAAKPVLTTRSSGSKGTSGSPRVGNPGSSPVKTRSSGASSSGGGSGSSHPVSTRSSGGGDGHGGGHDD